MIDSTLIIIKLNNAANRLFKDWRTLDKSSAELNLDKKYFYYLHARAWALKGWLGGTHSWFSFWSEEKNSWLVLELTDPETLDVQEADAIYIRNVNYTDHSPAISNRIPDARWFGSNPIIIASTENRFTYQDIETVCKEYQFNKFNLLNDNCNTFASYVIHKLGLGFSRPFRSIGFKTSEYWKSCQK